LVRISRAVSCASRAATRVLRLSVLDVAQAARDFFLGRADALAHIEPEAGREATSSTSQSTARSPERRVLRDSACSGASVRSMRKFLLRAAEVCNKRARGFAVAGTRDDRFAARRAGRPCAATRACGTNSGLSRSQSRRQARSSASRLARPSPEDTVTASSASRAHAGSVA
jgi:hypothetical protein